MMALVLQISGSDVLLAQLSPGKLARAHADLEGLENCTKCHSAGRQISPDNCLDCHILLKERIAAGEGLHAAADFQNCIDCHSDHHGRDFQLVYWKDGQENFDHEKTGYSLEGAHRKLECRQCHQPENIADTAPLLAQQKDLERTFLGLKQACLSCHFDEHRGQLGIDCAQCHNSEKWQPAPGFDHDNTSFRLTGKHRKLDCAKCHQTITDRKSPEDQSYVKYKDIAFAGCYSCHEDVHAGRFGNDCQSCHNTNGWPQLKNMAGFDHAQTRYPLEGKHLDLSCESCHKPGIPRRGLAFAECMDCHNDYHEGQFAQRTSGGACEECHTVDSFSPSHFTIADHDQTEFPLTGGHLAIPCIACHQQNVTARRNNRSMLKIHNFIFAALSCQTCHQDPHFGETEKFVQAGGCKHCHQVESWRQVSFDHSQTDFALRNKHAEIACLDCHTPTDLDTRPKHILFAMNSKDCESCHNDPHNGQFRLPFAGENASQLTTDCARCHDDHSWEPRGFDHNRDARFKLDVAHENVACEQCHPTIIEAEKAVLVFKPLEMQCQSCHG